MAESTSNTELDNALAEEIKEFHFHVYWCHHNPEWVKSAEDLYKKIGDLIKVGFFTVVLGKFWNQPIGPHLVASFEVWCPKEYFSRLYSWFLLNRNGHSILVHPLTRQEKLDHSVRKICIGEPIPLDPKFELFELLPDPPTDHGRHWIEHTQLKLGYSAPKENL